MQIKQGGWGRNPACTPFISLRGHCLFMATSTSIKRCSIRDSTSSRPRRRYGSGDDDDDARDFYLFISNTTSILGVYLGVACNPPKILMGHCERGARPGMWRQARVHSSVLHFCNLPCFACCLLTVVFVIAFTCQRGCCRLGFFCMATCM